jgi:hypothetical protein
MLMHEERGRFIAQQQRGGGLARIRRRPADGIIKMTSMTPPYCPFHKLFATGTKLQNSNLWQYYGLTPPTLRLRPSEGMNCNDFS